MSTSEALSIAIHVLNGEGPFSEETKKAAAEKIFASFASSMRRLTVPIEDLKVQGF